MLRQFVRSTQVIKDSPEIAFVTLIRGEWSAGDTPHTTRYPINPASPNVNTLLMKAGPVALPSASAVPIPPVTIATSLLTFCHGVIAVTSASFAAAADVDVAGVGGGAGRGATGRISPL